MTLSVTRQPRTPGVSSNPYFLYQWHTYQWARWAPPADWSGEVWLDFHVDLGEYDPQSDLWTLLATVAVNIDGIVSVVWGTRSEAYGSEAGPVSIRANDPVTIECFNFRRNIPYYVNAKWSGVINYPSGVPRPLQLQFGELIGQVSP